MIGLGYYLAKWGGRVADWLASLGNRVTSVYCIHWTVYCFMALVLICTLDSYYVSQWLLLPISVSVLVVSDLLSRLYVKLKVKKKRPK